MFRRIITLCFILFTGTLVPGMAASAGYRIFIQTDREVYAPGELLLFNLWQPESARQPAANETLHICLLNPEGKVVADSLFRLEDHRRDGQMALPDSLSEGEYNLLAWTSGMETGKPADVFSRNLYIRKYKLPGLIFHLVPRAGCYHPGDQAEVDVSIRFLDGKPFSNDHCNFIASRNGVPFNNGTATTDRNGEALLILPLPRDSSDNLITIRITAYYKGYEGSAILALPVSGTPFLMNFFPEGGTLIDGFQTKVGFTARDFKGDPLDFTAVLLDQDDQPVDTIRSTRSGIGSFEWLPDLTDPLKVHFLETSGIYDDIPLPVPDESGIQMILTDRSPKRLRFHIRSTFLHANQKLTVVAGNTENSLTEIPLVLDDSLSFDFPLKGDETGILRVSLLNETGTVLAQRPVFFPGRSRKIHLGVEPKQIRMKRTGKITLKINDDNGKPVKADICISLTDNTLCPDWSQTPDIRSWFLLGPASKDLPPGYLDGPVDKDDRLVDDLMLGLIDKTALPDGQNSALEVQKTSEEDFYKKVLDHFRPSDNEKLIRQFHRYGFPNDHLLAQFNNLDGFIRKNRTDLEEMGMIPVRPTLDDQIRSQLEMGIPVLTVLKKIHPYQIINGELFFRPNHSIFPKGALIVIDSIPRGTSIEILDDYPPFEFTQIRVSMKTADILRFGGEFDGVVLLTTRKYNRGVEMSIPKPVRPFHPDLLWNPSAVLNETGTIHLNINRSELRSTFRLKILGIDSGGNYLESGIIIPSR